MRARLRRTAALPAAVAIMAVLALAGCTPPSPSSTPTPSPSGAAPSPTGSATPTPEPEALSPEPVLDLDCGDLTTASLSGVLPGDRTPRDPGVSIMNALPTIAPVYSIRSLGGIACEWSNGVAFSPQRGFAPGYQGVRVFVLPNGTAQFDRYVDYYGSAGLSCSSDGSFCESNDLVGTTWIGMRVEGGSSATAASALVGEIAGVVSAAGPGADPWVPPTGTADLPTSCAGIVPDATVSSALGVGVPVQSVGPAGGWSLEAGADVQNGTVRCSWLYLDSDSGVGAMGALHGGAWAWAEARPSLTAPSVPAELAVSGLGADDEAWIRCASDGSTCTVDLVIAGNWIEFSLWPPDWAPGPAFDRRAGAEALAAAIVAAYP